MTGIFYPVIKPVFTQQVFEFTRLSYENNAFIKDAGQFFRELWGLVTKSQVKVLGTADAFRQLDRIGWV